MPVPARLTVCGLLAASSLKVSVPVTVPFLVGEKVTPTVQVAPGAILVPQVLLDIAKCVVTTMLEKVSETFWSLVRITVLGKLVLRKTTLPKFKVLVESVTGLPLPVPVRLTTWGLPEALSVKVREPVKVPTAVGENSTPTLQLAPAARLVPQLLLEIVKPAPLIAMLEIVTDTVP